jgi:RimJ/RimL family protein N-acetyltransferase
LRVVSKTDLSAEQNAYLRRRLSSPVHAADVGPLRVWDHYPTGLYAVIDQTTGMPIGLAEASGAPNAINPSWWIDQEFRGQKYGNALVDALAEYLKAHGVTGVVGKIAIDGPNHEQSAKLAKRFRAHFSA